MNFCYATVVSRGVSRPDDDQIHRTLELVRAARELLKRTTPYPADPTGPQLPLDGAMPLGRSQSH
jgi:hypothetical protein